MQAFAASAAMAVMTAQNVDGRRPSAQRRGLRARAPALGARAARRDAAGAGRAAHRALERAQERRRPGARAGRRGGHRARHGRHRRTAQPHHRHAPGRPRRARRRPRAGGAHRPHAAPVGPDHHDRIDLAYESGPRDRTPRPRDRGRHLPPRAGGPDQRRQARRRRHRRTCRSPTTRKAITIRVQDDGPGFEPDAHHEGFGLIGVRERVALTGGTLRIESALGAGTTLEATLPARRRQDEAPPRLDVAS